MTIDSEAAQEIAQLSRGTPRIANRLLRRVRDFAEVLHNGEITLRWLPGPWIAWKWIGRVWMPWIVGCFCCWWSDLTVWPGLDTLAAALVVFSPIEDVYEPFLLQEGYLMNAERPIGDPEGLASISACAPK